MTRGAQNSLLTAIQFQNMAINYLECIKHEVGMDGVQFLNNLINRLKANERDCKFRITTGEGRALFDSEIVKTDAFLYSNIFLTLLDCDDKKKEQIEKLVLAIHRGEIIEFIEPKEMSNDLS